MWTTLCTCLLLLCLVLPATQAPSVRLSKHTLVIQAEAGDLAVDDKHPRVQSAGAAGLAKGCLTYSQRYAAYEDFFQLHGTSWNPNIEIPDSSFTVILRVHHGLKWSRDLRLSVRAMMTECRRAGLHFWVLHQDTTGDQSKSDSKPTDFILGCPAEIRPVLHTFTANWVHDAYPLLHQFNKPFERDYLSYLLFMQRYHAYKFAWVVESDVRFTGPDWGALLNSMLNMAAASLENRTFQEYDSSLIAVPTDDVELPDLVLMNHHQIPDEAPITEKSKPRDVERWQFRNFHKVFVNLWGMSRQYSDIAHEHSVEGNGGYVEDFVASMGMDNRLSIVSVPHAEFGGASFHCCIPDGTRYYTDWYMTGECRQFALNHPVKNDNESIWGKVATVFDS